MAEEKTGKTPAEGKTPQDKPTQKPVRDKNGRFAGKNQGSEKTKDDGTVKIKVAKTSKAKKDNPEGKTEGLGEVKVSIIEVPDIKELIDRLFEDDECEAGSCGGKIVETPEGDIEVDGKTYYSQENVSKMLARTIGTCAKAATEEIERATTEASKCPICEAAKAKEAAEKVRIVKMAKRFAAIAANIICTAVCIGLVSAAGFGIYKLITLCVG